MITAEKLKEIFYSGFDGACDWQLLDELEVLIREKALNYAQETIGIKESYLKVIDRIRVVDGLGPQGKGHMALKEIGKNYLEERGKKSLPEFYIVGLHPDLVSSDKKIIIECGTTDPAGVSIFLSEQNISFVGILPYPDDTNDLVLHKFSRGKNFWEYKNWRLSKLREDFQKARNFPPTIGYK